MSKRSKSHHFVPRALQRQFCIVNDLIWWSKRDRGGLFKTPELASTAKSFCTDNFYSVLRDGELSDVVEKEFYGPIDTYFGALLLDLSDAFVRGDVPVFSGDALTSVRNVVFEMLKRTPEFIERLNEDEIGQQVFEEILKKMPDKFDDVKAQSETLRQLASGGLEKAYGRDVRVRATLSMSDRVTRELEGFSVRWAVSKSHHSFVLSSLMVYRIGNGAENGLSNPNVEIWMPLLPRVALVLVRDGDKKIPLISKINSQKIREINEYAIRNSTQIASHSQKLIESLIGRKSRFGTTHFLKEA